MKRGAKIEPLSSLLSEVKERERWKGDVIMCSDRGEIQFGRVQTEQNCSTAWKWEGPPKGSHEGLDA